MFVADVFFDGLGSANTENKKEGKWHSIICKGKSLKKCMFNDIILSTEGMCKGD